MRDMIRFNKNVTIIALQETGEVVKRLAATEKEARGWVRSNGWVPLDVEKTAAGETVIWVA